MAWAVKLPLISKQCSVPRSRAWKKRSGRCMKVKCKIEAALVWRWTGAKRSSGTTCARQAARLRCGEPKSRTAQLSATAVEERGGRCR